MGCVTSKDEPAPTPAGVPLTDEQALALAGIKFFKSLKEAEIKKLAEGFKATERAAGSVIVKKDDISKTYYVIYSGSVIIQGIDLTLEAGKGFGEIGLVKKSSKREHDVIAGPEGAVLLELEFDMYEELRQNEWMKDVHKGLGKLAQQRMSHFVKS